MSDDINLSPENSSEEQPRRERGATSQRNTIIWGTMLILIGIVFMLQNFGFPFLQNWWALFILIPAFGAFSNAWRSYQNADGRLTDSGRGSLIGGLVLTLISAIFLFNLNWNTLAPAILILAGVGILVNALISREG